MKSSLGTKNGLSVVRSACNNENGAVLVIGLMFMAILAMLGTTAVVMTTTDMQIGANYKTSVQAFNAAQAGIEEARARMRGNATNPITDSAPTDATWETYIGTDTLAQHLSGYATGDTRTDSDHTFTDMDYAVQIVHATDAGGNVLYWGDSNGDGISDRNTTGDGNNIYLVTCYGTTITGGGVRRITVEMARVPIVNPLAALYVEDNADINSALAEVDGTDQCGGTSNLAGVATTEPQVSATDPVYDHHGSVTGTPPVDYDAPVLDIQSIVDTYKSMADYTISGGTYTNQNWGTPTGLPTTPDCSVSNIVYASSDVTLNTTTGCGILLVDGNLRTQAGFQWYGLVFVTGCLVNYSGNASSDGIYGAVLVGGGCQSNVSGNVKLHYCSTAVDDSTKNMPLHALTWKDDF